MCTDCSFPRVGLLGLAQTGPLPSPQEVAPGLEVYPRDAWARDNRPPTGELYPESVYFLLIHHSAGPAPRTESDPIVEMQEIYDFHTGPTKEWPDVAYNFFIDQYGRVFEGRAGSLKGPVMANAVGGSQGYAQLVCVLGDYTNDVPTVAAQESLNKTLAWLADRHELETGPEAFATFESRGSNLWPEGIELTVNTISGHRDVSDTACPGDAFYPIVRDELPTRVSDQRAGRVAAVTEPTEANTSTVPDTTVPPTTEGTAAVTTGTTTAATTVTPTIAGPTSPSNPPTTATTAATTAATPPSGSGPWGLFVRGALGGTAAVGVVGGLAWVISRRRENERRVEP